MKVYWTETADGFLRWAKGTMMPFYFKGTLAELQARCGKKLRRDMFMNSQIVYYVEQ